MVGTCVAFSGAIGFVGLIVPYILRLLFRSNYYFILPLSAIFGAVLLLVADTFSRSIVAPSELPIGILTALMGTNFIAILMKHKSLYNDKSTSYKLPAQEISYSGRRRCVCRIWRILAIVPNGAGKSSLLSVLANEIKQDKNNRFYLKQADYRLGNTRIIEAQSQVFTA